MRSLILAFIALALPVPAIAQGLYIPPPAAPDTSNLATKADVAAAQSTVTSTATTAASTAAAALAAANAACKAIPSIPPTEMVGGNAGTAGTSCRPTDSAQPRISRAGVVNTDSSGNWSITWSTAAPAVPVVLPIPVNSTSQPVICNIITRTTTAASGKCWLARTLPATLLNLAALLNFDLFGTAASSISVQVLAIPPTQ